MQKKAGHILVSFAMLLSSHLYASNGGAQKPKHCKSIRVLTFTYDKDKRDSSFGVIRSRFVNMNQGNVSYPNLIIRVRNKYNVVVRRIIYKPKDYLLDSVAGIENQFKPKNSVNFFKRILLPDKNKKYTIYLEVDCKNHIEL